MSQRRRRKKPATCYMCERNYVSKEHVPPKSFFPEKGELDSGLDYRKNLITVPSCEFHNLEKSDDDQYLLFVVVSSFRASDVAQKLFSKKIIRAIKRRPSLGSFYRDNFKVEIGGKETMGYRVDRNRFDDTISKLVSALYFYTYKEKWVDRFFVFSPEIYSTNSNAAEVNSTMIDLEKKTGMHMKNQEFLGSNPAVFRYKIMRRENYVLARMLFYQGVVINAFSDNNQFAA